MSSRAWPCRHGAMSDRAWSDVNIMRIELACLPPNKDEVGIPLHKVAFEGYQELVELLSEKDVRINLQNTAGRTALMRAREAGQAKVASVLRNQGTNIRAVR